MTAPVTAVPLEELTSGDQLFRCVPYSCTMLARACVERQAKVSEGIDVITLHKCKGCALGAQVKARAAGVHVDLDRLRAQAKKSGAHRTAAMRSPKFKPRGEVPFAHRKIDPKPAPAGAALPAQNPAETAAAPAEKPAAAGGAVATKQHQQRDRVGSVFAPTIVSEKPEPPAPNADAPGCSHPLCLIRLSQHDQEKGDGLCPAHRQSKRSAEIKREASPPGPRRAAGIGSVFQNRHGKWLARQRSYLGQFDTKELALAALDAHVAAHGPALMPRGPICAWEGCPIRLQRRTVAKGATCCAYHQKISDKKVASAKRLEDAAAFVETASKPASVARAKNELVLLFTDEEVARLRQASARDEEALHSWCEQALLGVEEVSRPGMNFRLTPEGHASKPVLEMVTAEQLRGEQQVKTPGATDYSFPLRHDFKVGIALPVNFNKRDAERLARFLGALAFED